VLIERATSKGRVPAGTLLTLPSGRVTCMLSMGNFQVSKPAFPTPFFPRDSLI